MSSLAVLSYVPYRMLILTMSQTFAFLHQISLQSHVGTAATAPYRTEGNLGTMYIR